MRAVLLLLLLAIALILAVAVSGAEESERIDDLHALASTTFGESAEEKESTCLICVIGLTLVDNGIKNEDESIASIVAKACAILPGKGDAICRKIISVIGPEALRQLLKVYSPNRVCSDFGFCKTCHLAPARYSADKEAPGQNDARILAGFLALALRHNGVANAFSSQKPWVDLDKDGYSPLDLHRGAHWRARDCDDINHGMHPLAPVSADGDRHHDHNCNGIHGSGTVGLAYESAYCNRSNMRSIAVFGDSASSGFHIPVEWIQLHNLHTLIASALDEFDVPQRSWDTGFESDIEGESIYLHNLERDLCNHRQFANLGQNGAEMKDLVDQVKLLNSSALYAPLLAFVSYSGNDVCQDSLDLMTTPQDFRAQLIAGLTLLDSFAPAGSKVVLVSPVDGRILYDTMHNREHPLGSTYAEFYNFLSCTGANPCWTWLNSDEAVRNATTARAVELGDVLEEVAATQKNAFKNLELAYEEFPLDEAIALLEKENKDPSVLIEPVDGFHPSPYAHRLVSQLLWSHMSDQIPSFLSQSNPHNDKIREKFGDQGGY